MGIVHEHRVDLTGRDAVAAGRVDVQEDRAVAREELLLEHGGRHFIGEPALLSDDTLQEQGAGLVCVLDPVSEVAHRLNLLFGCRFE